MYPNSWQSQSIYPLLPHGAEAYRNLQFTATAGFWIYNPASADEIWISARFSEIIWGKDQAQVGKQSLWLNSLLAASQEEYRALEKRVLTEEDQHSQMRCILRKDTGEKFYCQLILQSLVDESGQIQGLLGLLLDLDTVWHRQELQEDCNRMASIGFWEYNRVQNELSWSEETKRIHEVPPDYQPDLKTAFHFYPAGPTRKRIKEVVETAQVRGTGYDEILPITTAQGREKTVRVIGKAEFYQGQCIRIYGTFQDLSESVRQERELEAANYYLKSIVDGTELGIWEWNTQTGRTVFNENWAQILGYRLEELEPYDIQTWWQFLHPDDSQRSQKLLKAHFEGESEYYEFKGRMRHKDGHWVWVLEKGKVFTWTPEGKPEMMYGTQQDISQQIELEEELRLDRDLFQAIFDQAGNGSVLVSPSGKMLRVNQPLCDLLGYSEEELLKRSFQDITHRDDLAADLSLLQAVLAGKRDSYQMEKRYIHRDGEIIYSLLTVSAIRNPNGEVLYLVSQIIDLSPQKHLEQELRRSLAEQKSILKVNNSVALLGIDPSGKVKIFSQGASNVLGIPAQKIEGENLFDFIQGMRWMNVHRDQAREGHAEVHSVEGLMDMAHPELNNQTLEIIRQDAAPLPVVLSVAPIKNDTTEYGVLLVATEISDLLKTQGELKIALEMTEQQNDQLTNFTHIVSHNLRSHSSNISTALEYLLDDQPTLKESELVNLLQQSDKDMSSTIRHLTQQAQQILKGTVKPEPLDLSAVIKGALHNVASLARKAQVELCNEAEASLPPVSGTRAYLDSVVLNLLTNAIKYRSADRASWVKIQTQRQNSHILLHIEDNGQGIDMEKHGEDLFKRGKTFHHKEDSRGLGLYMTKRQVRAMDGSIAVTSTAGKGSTFTVKLNLYEDSPSPTQ